MAFSFTYSKVKHITEWAEKPAEEASAAAENLVAAAQACLDAAKLASKTAKRSRESYSCVQKAASDAHESLTRLLTPGAMPKVVYLFTLRGAEEHVVDYLTGDFGDFIGVEGACARHLSWSDVTDPQKHNRNAIISHCRKEVEGGDFDWKRIECATAREVELLRTVVEMTRNGYHPRFMLHLVERDLGSVTFSDEEKVYWEAVEGGGDPHEAVTQWRKAKEAVDDTGDSGSVSLITRRQ